MPRATVSRRQARRLALLTAASLVRAHLSVGGVLHGVDAAGKFAELDIDGPDYERVAAALSAIAERLDDQAGRLAEVEP